MHVLITGATGLIGKELGKLLIHRGHTITAVSRTPEKARIELPFPAKLVKWAGCEEAFPAEALNGVDAVVHLAGEPVADHRWTEKAKKQIRDSRVLGTQRLVDAILGHPQAKQQLTTFVHGSATGYYGDRADEVLGEDAAAGEGFLAEVVRDWEAQADRLKESLPALRLSKVRTGVVLARHGGALSMLAPIFSKGLGGNVGKGLQWMSWIHINDIARLFAFCVESESALGVLNGTAPEPVRNERFTVLLARALDRQVFLPTPEMALKVALGEMSSALLGSQRVLPQATRDAGFSFQFPDLAHALDELCGPLRRAQHELLTEQWLPLKPDELFSFFCDETNLERLTPSFLRFKVIGKSTDTITDGTLIDYRLRLRGWPMKWRSRIESWRPGECFTDTQVQGPYRRWHHTHEFVPMAGGTLLRDRVLYQLPLGVIGDVLGSWRVNSDVRSIFRFRRRKIAEIFGNQS